MVQLHDFFTDEVSALSFGDNVFRPTGRPQPVRWYPGINSHLPLARGLVQAIPFWHSEYLYGDKILWDYSGHRFHGTSSNGAELQPTELGKAARIGVDRLGIYTFDYNNVDSQTNLFGDMAWSFWIKPEDPATCFDFTQGIFWCRVWDQAGTNDDDLIDISLRNSTTLGGLEIKPRHDTTQRIDFTWDYNHWSHVVIQRKAKVWYLYVNGKEIGSVTTSLVGYDQLYINEGYQLGQDSSAHQWNGYITCYHLWQRSLTDSEVAGLLSDPWQLHEPPPPHYAFPQTFSETSSGGVLVGGACGVTIGEHCTGGVLAGGRCALTITIPSNGGLVVGGIGTPGYPQHSTGGLVVGGSTVVYYGVLIHSAGGLRLGQGHGYYLPITVPAGKVSADLDPFVLMLNILVPNYHVVGGAFRFMDSDENALLWEKLDYDQDTGRLHAAVKTTLLADVYNTIYLWYGGTA